VKREKTARRYLMKYPETRHVPSASRMGVIVSIASTRASHFFADVFAFSISFSLFGAAIATHAAARARSKKVEVMMRFIAREHADSADHVKRDRH